MIRRIMSNEDTYNRLEAVRYENSSAYGLQRTADALEFDIVIMQNIFPRKPVSGQATVISKTQ